MALPRQVEAQLRELEIIEKQLSDEQALQGKPEPTEPETNVPPPEPVAAQPEVKPEKPVEPEVPEDTWQQKYRTLKGMYDAEVPRLHSQVKELSSRVEQIQREAAAPKPEVKPATQEKLVTDDDVQAFGADLIEVQRKVAREVAMEFRKDIEDLRSENVKLREQMTTTGSQVSEASFEQRLHRMVPDFDALNADERWVDWLNETDPLLRAPRKTVAQEAFNRGDAEAVAYYVGMFRQGLTPVEQPSNKAAELERQIQPNRSAAGSTPISAQGRIYTDAAVQKMYLKAANLASSGKHEEARKLEAEIDAAFMENRVTA